MLIGDPYHLYQPNGEKIKTNPPEFLSNFHTNVPIKNHFSRFETGTLRRIEAIDTFLKIETYSVNL